MAFRILVSALAGALMATLVLVAYQVGRSEAAVTLQGPGMSLSALDGREVFDEDGMTVGVVEQTVPAPEGQGAAGYAMVRVSRDSDAGLRLAVPVHRLLPVEDGLMLTVENAAAEDGSFQPAVAQLRHRI
jgi:sporulation protein YlmC with PRC-barrel domain